MIERHEISALMRGVGDVVRAKLAEGAAAIMALRAQVDALDRTVREIPAGRDGKDADPEAVRSIITDEVTKAVAAIPVPKDGQDGKPGESIIGPQGIPGESIKGDKGDEGPPGKDADPEQIRATVAHEVARAIEGIPPPKDGRDGKDISVEAVREMIAVEVTRSVAALPPAKDGKDAEPIHPDTIALMVVTEVGKAVERAVAAMPKPQDGRDGLDAIRLNIHPSIDASKSVPRGTYGTHQGGILCSNRLTTPGESLNMAEWDVIVDGVASITWKQSDDDPRMFAVECLQTSGKSTRMEAYIPVPLYKEIWRSTEDYRKGDVVQRDGSGWICTKDGTKTQPGLPNSDWKLFIKRGQDGKPGQPGPTGPKGDDGRHGRDLTQMDFNGQKH